MIMFNDLSSSEHNVVIVASSKMMTGWILRTQIQDETRDNR